MCLALPAKIVTCDLANESATVDMSGVRKDVSLMLVEGEAAVGDYVLVHVGFALTVLSAAEAEKTLALMHEAERAGQAQRSGGEPSA